MSVLLSDSVFENGLVLVRVWYGVGVDGCLSVIEYVGVRVSVCLGEWVSECMCVGVSMYLEVCGSACMGDNVSECLSC